MGLVYSEHGGVVLVGGGVRAEANKPPLCQTLCMQLSPQTLEGSPSKDSALRDLPLSDADICTAHPQTGRGFFLPDTKASVQCSAVIHAWSTLTVTTDYHFLNPHHHQPQQPSHFQYLSPNFGRICEQFWLDLYVAKLGWKTSKFGGFERPGVPVSPSPISSAPVCGDIYGLPVNYTLYF